MLTDRTVTAPGQLINTANRFGTARTLIAGADTTVALESARSATDAGLIEPVLIGDHHKIATVADEVGWDITPFQIVRAQGDAGISEATALAVQDTSIEIIMKGHVHTDALMSALLRKDTGLRTGRRLSHVFHMTLPEHERALLISDGALNIAPDAKTFQAIAQNLVQLCHALGLERPKIAVLSATEEKLPNMPSSLAAAELTDWARDADLGADISGPLAFDNAVSMAAAKIKGLAPHPVAGSADALIVPSIETGNALYKMMVYFMGACAAGVVIGGRLPIIITSRADAPAARLASVALARVSSGA